VQRHRISRRPILRAAAATVLALGLLAAAGCRSAIAGIGAAGGSPAAKADDFFGALAVRFGVAWRDQRFEAIRPRMIRHALTPSGIYPDTTIWTSIEGEVRTVTVAGEIVGDRYLLSARPVVARPDAPGKSRHAMHLRRVTNSVHQWDSTDELAIGTARATEVFSVLGGALRGVERPASDIRADYRASFPLTTAMLARLFVLDTLRTVAEEDGSTSISIATRLEAERMRPYAPRYAAYIDEYLKPLRFEATLIDDAGASWATVRFRRNLLELRLRSRDGRLQPLAGGSATGTPTQPDSMRLRISFFAKVLFFDVGTSNLIADVVPFRSADARGWSLRFRQEPKWHFPLAVGRLLRAPLRRPFADGGTRLEYLVRDTTDGQTVLARNIHIVVQESAIVRWLGALGATAMGDLSLQAEQEKDRFVGEVFRAMAEDARLLLPR
jgi:hypothetical protein